MHLGHHNTPTVHILRSLRRLFPDNDVTGALDLIVIAGDLFDRLLNLPDDNVAEIKYWMKSFLSMCARRNIKVRVLEGTPSHDWKQNRLMVDVQLIGEIPVDLKYVDKLSVEIMSDWGISLLYIPDEWRPRCDDTWAEALVALQQSGLEKVDFVVMHGAFHHQMPKNIHKQLELHTAERYISITNLAVYVGHVHQMSVYDDMIYSAGSTDRLTHGDEAPKGYWKGTFYPSGEKSLQFIENPNAMRYDTINCVGLVGDALNHAILEKVNTLPQGSHIRLKATKADIAAQSISVLETKYPGFHWTLKTVDGGGDAETPILMDTRPKFQGVSISKENIVELLMERIAVKHPDHRLRCQTVLEEIIHG